MLWATDDRARAIVDGRRVLLNGADVTNDCQALCVCPGRQAVVLIERPTRIDRSGPEPTVAKRLVYGRVELR